MAFTDQDADSLADKLAAMELTNGEREALNTVFAAASDDEAIGFARHDVATNAKYAPTIKSLLGADIGIPQVVINHEEQY